MSFADKVRYVAMPEWQRMNKVTGQIRLIMKDYKFGLSESEKKELNVLMAEKNKLLDFIEARGIDYSEHLF